MGYRQMTAHLQLYGASVLHGLLEGFAHRSPIASRDCKCVRRSIGRPESRRVAGRATLRIVSSDQSSAAAAVVGAFTIFPRMMSCRPSTSTSICDSVL